MTDEARALRFKITLAPARALSSQNGAPSTPTPVAHQPPQQEQYQEQSNSRLACTDTPRPPSLPSGPGWNNLVHAARQQEETLQPHSLPPSMPLTTSSLGRSRDAPAAPATSTSSPPPLSLSEPGHSGGRDHMEPQSLYVGRTPQQRYGGGLVRISELRQQGVDVLLPAMTPGTGGRLPSRRGSSSTTPSVAAAAPASLPADLPLSQIFAGPSASTSAPDLAPSSTVARDGGRGRRTRKARNSTTGARNAALELQEDGTPYAYRWFVQHGRRVLVYNGVTYKGTKAHRLWTQIKRASGATGTRSRRAPSAKAGKRGEVRRVASAQGSTVSTAQKGRDRPLTLYYGGTDAVADSTRYFAGQVDLEPCSQRGQPPKAMTTSLVRTATPVRVPPSRHVPVKLPLRPPPSAGAHGGRDENVSASPQLVGVNVRGRSAGVQGSSQPALVNRGLSCLTFQPSQRALAATNQAGGSLQPGLSTFPPAAPHHLTVAHVMEVVEVSDDDHNDGEGGPSPPLPDDRVRATDTAVAARKRSRESASSNVPRSHRQERNGGTEADTASSLSSLSSWPNKYFDDALSSSTENSFPGTSSDSEDEDGSKRVRRADAVDEVSLGAVALPASDSSPCPEGCHSVADIKIVRVNGHRMAEVDGWLYPMELLPMLSQQRQHGEGPKCATGSTAATDAHSDAKAPPSPVEATVDPPACASRVLKTLRNRTSWQAGGVGTHAGGGLTVLGAPSVRPAPHQPCETAAFAHTAVTARRTEPETDRYDNGAAVLDALMTDEAMEDLFDRGDEIGGFRF